MAQHQNKTCPKCGETFQAKQDWTFTNDGELVLTIEGSCKDCGWRFEFNLDKKVDEINTFKNLDGE